MILNFFFFNLFEIHIFFFLNQHSTSITLIYVSKCLIILLTFKELVKTIIFELFMTKVEK